MSAQDICRIITCFFGGLFFYRMICHLLGIASPLVVVNARIVVASDDDE
jgi:hypothetical protein